MIDYTKEISKEIHKKKSSKNIVKYKNITKSRIIYYLRLLKNKNQSPR